MRQITECLDGLLNRSNPYLVDDNRKYDGNRESEQYFRKAQCQGVSEYTDDLGGAKNPFEICQAYPFRSGKSPQGEIALKRDSQPRHRHVAVNNEVYQSGQKHQIQQPVSIHRFTGRQPVS